MVACKNRYENGQDINREHSREVVHKDLLGDCRCVLMPNKHKTKSDIDDPAKVAQPDKGLNFFPQDRPNHQNRRHVQVKPEDRGHNQHPDHVDTPFWTDQEPSSLGHQHVVVDNFYLGLNILLLHSAQLEGKQNAHAQELPKFENVLFALFIIHLFVL